MTDPRSETEELGTADEALDEDPQGNAPGAEGDLDPAMAGEGADGVGDPAVEEALEELAEEFEDSMDAELVALREEFEALNDRHLRLAAEFNNYRRRVEAERLESWSRAQADMVGRFLDVLDDLQRVAGLDLSNATVEAIMEGIDLVERKFLRVLGDAGIEIIDPDGERFDPERMEAMMRVPAQTEDDDEKVAQVFQKGYSLKGQLVRPARVSVHKHG